MPRGWARPWWDRKSGTVTFGGVTCKRFSRKTCNQIKILEAFQAARWPPSVRNPLPSPTELKNAVASMSRWDDSTIVFTHDGIEVDWSPKE